MAAIFERFRTFLCVHPTRHRLNQAWLYNGIQVAERVSCTRCGKVFRQWGNPQDRPEYRQGAVMHIGTLNPGEEVKVPIAWNDGSR